MVRLAQVAVGLVLVAAVAFVIWGGPQTITTVCDGVFPKWVLDAQDYVSHGGGCAEVIPFDQAPEDADWTPVYTGASMCGGEHELYIDGTCTSVPSDRPWPSSVPHP